MKDLKALSIATGIPEVYFKEALGIPPDRCEVMTTAEARAIYEADPKGSDAARTALAKWIELCTTTDEARTVYSFTLGGSDDERAALAKWIELCTTTDEARTVYYIASKGSEAERLALKKIYDLF